MLRLSICRRSAWMNFCLSGKELDEMKSVRSVMLSASRLQPNPRALLFPPPWLALWIHYKRKKPPKKPRCANPMHRRIKKGSFHISFGKIKC